MLGCAFTPNCRVQKRRFFALASNRHAKDCVKVIVNDDSSGAGLQISRSFPRFYFHGASSRFANGLLQVGAFDTLVVKESHLTAFDVKVIARHWST
jgi:hypothetical protein